MRTNYVLIDYENLPVKSLELLQEPHFRLRVFLGPKNSKLPTELVVAMQRMGERGEYVVLETSSTNALDFHIAYYLGRLALEEPTSFFHIISGDKGFEPLLKHLKGKGIYAVRSESIEAMPCFKALPAIEATIAATAAGGNKSPSSNPAPSKPAPKKTKTPVSGQLKVAMHDLISRKGAKPRTIAKLINTIHSTLGKASGVKLAEAEAVYKQLCDQGFVKVNGDKVTYSLPERV
ncbi:PIN domain-containing protein [Pseudomonas aeruginosa]|uniref:PIN domain-containing protein n=1 Tax=Pseudomonas aeruginosa TaxID=287 RepID=UPI00053DFCD5|nr:PIN domain-containing protein [Pseudomonas aeruginosa]ELK4821909.1 hypothetical protein [Pseudomonas aeruginosa]ELM5707034.1 hypothetical protein [Pseudomonas aeruginosa]MCU8974694.1 PIN domain-containing protein [Pseudomonas aeruginosa]MCU8980881.1 PIN domain-containing protein [Pseudomonas aeruginosa]MCU8987242.1 PIN domain-containing protein [Pseudomonas aeruginosa]